MIEKEPHILDDHLNLVIEKSGKITHILLNGILETSNSHGFEQFVLNLIDKGDVQFVIGIKNLSYVSSTGVGGFLTILKACKTHHGNVVLYDMTARVKESFDLLGFSKFFKIFPSFRESVNYLQASEHEELPLFPLAIGCPRESHPLQINKPGTYSCPHCQDKFRVSETGEVIELAPSP